jgi:glycogen operon protein
VLWSEWNGIYRDNVRRFWKGDGGLLPEFSTRLTGSSDLYKGDGRKPYASINFITCHDGFTLQDFVSYNDKHNEANGENNQDGTNENNSWNCGAEGPTDDSTINALRTQQKRNFVATLLFSAGVPMLLAGDEIGHTQQGNNNAYCQDNETTWLKWNITDEQRAFLGFVRSVINIRQTQPVFQRRKFFLGRQIDGAEVPDISWFQPSGEEMSDEAWNAGYTQCLGVRLPGDLIGDVNERGEPITGDSILLLVNAHHEPIPFMLSSGGEGQEWERLIDTADPEVEAIKQKVGEQYEIQGRSIVILRSKPPQPAELPDMK